MGSGVVGGAEHLEPFAGVKDEHDACSLEVAVLIDLDVAHGAEPAANAAAAPAWAPQGRDQLTHGGVELNAAEETGEVDFCLLAVDHPASLVVDPEGQVLNAAIRGFLSHGLDAGQHSDQGKMPGGTLAGDSGSLLKHET